MGIVTKTKANKCMKLFTFMLMMLTSMTAQAFDSNANFGPLSLTCPICNVTAIFREERIDNSDPHAGFYGWVYRPKACTIPATIKIHCRNCDRVQQMNIRLGHDWAFDEHIDANCTEGGGDRYKCQRCDETEMRNSVAALGHLWTADAICERCGISAPPINYIGASGQATCSDYHIIVGSGDLEVGTSTKNSWYAVYGDVNLTTLKFIDKTSNIILKDGAKLTITSTNSNDAIHAKSLNIYSESGGSGTLDVSCNRSAIYALYTLNIYGGNISATAGNAHAITANESLTIHGGTITARSTTDGNGIFCVIGNITITGGNINATGSNTIDSYGINASLGTLTLGWTGSGNITANSYKTKKGTVIFTRPFRDDEGHVYSGSADEGSLGGKTLINTELIYDDADNDIAAIAGTTNVTLLGRTIYRDGDWNTLCLPFNVPQLNSTSLKDCTVKELDTETAYNGHVTGFDGTTLYMNFKDANSIVAGRPYIVKKNAPTFTPIGGTSNNISGYGYEKLMDGKKTTMWFARIDNAPACCEFQSDEPSHATSYALTTSGYVYLGNNTNPTVWTLKAKLNESDTWTVIDSRNANTNSDDALPSDIYSPKSFTIQQPGDYQYYRLEITGVVEGDYVAVQEMTMQGNCVLNAVDPFFSGVTISSDAPMPVVSNDGAVTFTGSFSPVSFTANDKSILFLGAENKLYWPNADMTLGACRAYFKLGTTNASKFVMNFGNGGDATSIRSLSPDPSPSREGSEYWYDMSGRKLSQQPTQKGVYINNGRKVVIN